MTRSGTAPQRSTAAAAVWLILAAVLWSSNGLFVRSLNGSDMGGWGIAGFRSLFACLFLTPWVWRRRQPIRDGVWVLAAVLAFSAMCATFVHAITRTTVANAIWLQYTAPAWVFLLSPWITRERASGVQFVSLAFSLVGIGVIFFEQYEPGQTGLLLGLGSGFVFGIQTVLFRRVRSVDPLVMAWLACAGSALLTLPVSFVTESPTLTSAAMRRLALMGLVQFALPYVLYCIAINRLRAQQAALIILVEPVLSPVWVWLSIGEVPHPSTLVGGCFILAGVVCVIHHQLTRAARLEFPGG